MSPKFPQIVFGAFVATLCLSMPSAHAEWFWSPSTGWVGPGGLVKGTPAEQFEYAKGLFEAGEYEEAIKEFRKLVDKYEASKEAAEAQYYIGRSHEEEQSFYDAFKAYRKTIQTYPATARFEEILSRQYRIGNYFLGGNKRKIFGKIPLLPARDKAIEIFSAIVEDGPFSEHGPLAQYKLGLAHLALEEYEMAVEELEQLITRYPESQLVDDARYQIALASLKGTFKPGYDQSATDKAIKELEAFLEIYPESELAAEAENRLEELRDRRAAHEFQIGRFYLDSDKPEAAKVYFQTIVDDYPSSPWAAQAVAALQAMGDDAQ